MGLFFFSFLKCHPWAWDCCNRIMEDCWIERNTVSYGHHLIFSLIISPCERLYHFNSWVMNLWTRTCKWRDPIGQCQWEWRFGKFPCYPSGKDEHETIEYELSQIAEQNGVEIFVRTPLFVTNILFRKFHSSYDCVVLVRSDASGFRLAGFRDLFGGAVFAEERMSAELLGVECIVLKRNECRAHWRWLARTVPCTGPDYLG